MIKRPTSPGVSDVFAKLFQARTEIHQYHLKTPIFAEHIATDELYKSVLKSADKIIETTQGYKSQIIEFDVPECKAPSNIIPYLQQLVTYFEISKSMFSPDVRNMIDDLNGSINQALYKLTFLK